MGGGRLLALRILTLIAAMALSAAASAQHRYVVIPRLEPFVSLNVARRINVTLVRNAEVDRLPSDIYGRLVKNKAAMDAIRAGGRACIVRAEPSVAKAVKCVVEHGELSVYAEKFKYKRSPAIDVVVICDDSLRSISGTSGSNISSKGVLLSPGLSVTADFAMSIHLALGTKSVRVVARNDSEVRLSGTLGSVSADLSSSSLLMRNADCASVRVAASAGSKAQVNASASLALSATGHSSISYTTQGAAVVEASSDQTSKILATSIVN